MTKQEKHHIGDGVYVHLNQFNQIVLESSFGFGGEAQNVIYLEPDVMLELIKFSLQAKARNND